MTQVHITKAILENALHVSLSRTKKSKKSKNPRSALLSALMKQLGGDTGDFIASAFATGNVTAFKKAMTSVVDALVPQVEKMSKSSTANASESSADHPFKFLEPVLGEPAKRGNNVVSWAVGSDRGTEELVQGLLKNEGFRLKALEPYTWIKEDQTFIVAARASRGVWK